MPKVDENVLRRRRAAFEDEITTDSNKMSPKPNSTVSSNLPTSSLSKGGEVSLIDLDDIFGLSSTPVATALGAFLLLIY